MGRNTQQQVEARREAVERLVATGNWTRDAIRSLAREYGVTWQQVYMDRAIVLDDLKASLVDPDRTRAKTDLLVRARDLYRTCAGVQENRSTAARLLDFEARVVGAYEPLQVDVTHRVEAMPDTDLARQILDPEAHAWARAVLERVGESPPTLQLVLDVESEPVTDGDDP